MTSENLIIDGKPFDLGGGMIVKRVFPQVKKRMIGPFVFFDHMGPVLAKADQNIDVRPHPHIGLSTLTYLFEGRMVHRDSLGTHEIITPGEVNWMTAGSGISHSERSHDDDRSRDRMLHGLQLWIALPDGDEDVPPSFQHYSATQIPRAETEDYQLELVAGEGFGLRSQVKTSSPLLLAHISGKRAAKLEVNFPEFELAAYVVAGSLSCNGHAVAASQMFLLPRARSTLVEFSADAKFVVLGGKEFTTPRYVWWNLVSSSKEKIEAAKKRWKEGDFPMVPGETELTSKMRAPRSFSFVLRNV